MNAPTLSPRSRLIGLLVAGCRAGKLTEADLQDISKTALEQADKLRGHYREDVA